MAEGESGPQAPPLTRAAVESRLKELEDSFTLTRKKADEALQLHYRLAKTNIAVQGAIEELRRLLTQTS